MSSSVEEPGRIAVFGAFSDHDLYQRNRQLVATLCELHPDTRIINTRDESASHGFSVALSGLQRLRRLLGDFLALWQSRSALDSCLTVFVPYPAYLPLLVLRLSGRHRRVKIIADAFIELGSTVIEDRGLLRPGSLRSRLLLAFQRVTLGTAHHLLMDTPAHADLLRQRLGARTSTVHAVPVAIDETLWPALPVMALDGPVRVAFWGTFIPLHGAATIFQAAGLLQDRGLDFHFELIGDGPDASACAELADKLALKNITWTRNLLESARLKSAAENAHIVLGVFGTSEKADLVVPYKVQQALAMNRIVVTRHSREFPADEVQEHGLLTVEPGDPVALAEQLMAVRERLLSGWSPQPRQIYDQRFSSAQVRQALAGVLAS